MPSWDVRFDLRGDASSPRVVTAVARAEALAQVIRGIPIPPGLRKKLDSLNILRAVRGTTGIEGIELTEEEVAKIIGAPQQKRVLPPNRGREEQEARNAQYVMKFVAELVDRFPDSPLTERLICRIHKLTTEGIEYNSNVPGSYRNHPTIAGDYVPPRTGEEVRFLMKEFVSVK